MLRQLFFPRIKDDYISLTDIARSQLQDVVIIKWLSLKSTLEYLGEWELLNHKNHAKRLKE